MKKYKGFQLNYFDLCYIHSLILDKEKEAVYNFTESKLLNRLRQIIENKLLKTGRKIKNIDTTQ